MISMSKLYKKYVLLKIKNSSKIYLFESGIFYVFLDDDAKLMSNILNLKLTPLNSIIMKCGFPVKSSDKYFNILKTLNYNIEIVPADEKCSPADITSYITFQNYDAIIQDFLKVNIDDLSIGQAFDLLYQLQNKFNQIEEEKKENKNSSNSSSEII